MQESASKKLYKKFLLTKFNINLTLKTSKLKSRLVYTYVKISKSKK